MAELIPTEDDLNARYDPMTRDELIAECENMRTLLSIAQDRNAEHCAEVQRLEKILRDWGIQCWERRAHDVPQAQEPK